ncbi:MAG: hypothetical protein WBL21_08135, partial [Salinimicrobium sp.]
MNLRGELKGYIVVVTRWCCDLVKIRHCQNFATNARIVSIFYGCHELGQSQILNSKLANYFTQSAERILQSAQRCVMQR